MAQRQFNAQLRRVGGHQPDMRAHAQNLRHQLEVDRVVVYAQHAGAGHRLGVVVSLQRLTG